MRGMISRCMVIVCLAVFLTASAGETAVSAESLPLVESLRIEAPIEFCEEVVPLENREVRERLEKEILLAMWDRPQVILWIKRSNRHLAIIEAMLKENTMPDDLKYITLIESGLRPHVGSSKGAIGFWQFTEGTGEKYGLRIDEDIDERRSIVASTRAALRCLKEYHQTFGSWTLAAAAFNMGKEGLQTEILAQKTDNYYHLYMPLETQRYVLRIIAAKLIMTNREKYGFHLADDDLYPPITCDRVTVECPGMVPIRIVAEAAETHFKAIKDLNPEVRGYYLNKGSYTLSIPAGMSKRFHSRYRNLLDQWMAHKDEYVYVVKKGDNLSLIAERFGVPLPALFLWNNLKAADPIHPGDHLILYPDRGTLDEGR
ncbi:MAG: transglycosylase SLT domain-containing protein [Deltaproteobacteria bacterium]|nr:transglycosylase SLT domain-containing protein [Deltaproteobacteria bacterium]